MGKNWRRGRGLPEPTPSQHYARQSPPDPTGNRPTIPAPDFLALPQLAGKDETRRGRSPRIDALRDHADFAIRSASGCAERMICSGQSKFSGGFPWRRRASRSLTAIPAGVLAAVSRIAFSMAVCRSLERRFQIWDAGTRLFSLDGCRLLMPPGHPFARLKPRSFPILHLATQPEGG